jgi:hypothetical protein
MKVLFVFIFTIFSLNGFCEITDYQNGNGTIIQKENEGKYVIVMRKHEQKIKISEGTSNDYLIVYDKININKNNELFKLKTGDIIDITILLSRDNIETKKSETWLKITNEKKQSGWIFIGSANPYKNDQWSLLKSIETSNKKWTIRKLIQSIAVNEVINVRDKPGIKDTNILFKLIPPKGNPQINLQTNAITEQEDTIDGITDYWANITDEKGRTGWIFAGYATAERGGSKYLSPKNIISDYLENY